MDEMLGSRTVSHVPAGVVAQCWRGSARQHAIRRLLRSGAVRVDPLTEDLAFGVGVLLGAGRTSDVVAAHVALLARRYRATVVTSDPDDLTQLDPGLRLIVL